MNQTVKELARHLMLGSLLEEIVHRYGSYELLAHWQQGEFHHDLLLGLAQQPKDLPGPVLLVSTNCNGGVKEVAVFAQVPERDALWKHRCSGGSMAPAVGMLASARTDHWFDPCELLGD